MYASGVRPRWKARCRLSDCQAVLPSTALQAFSWRDYRSGLPPAWFQWHPAGFASKATPNNSSVVQRYGPDARRCLAVWMGCWPISGQTQFCSSQSTPGVKACLAASEFPSHCAITALEYGTSVLPVRCFRVSSQPGRMRAGAPPVSGQRYAHYSSLPNC